MQNLKRRPKYKAGWCEALSILARLRQRNVNPMIFICDDLLTISLELRKVMLIAICLLHFPWCHWAPKPACHQPGFSPEARWAELSTLMAKSWQQASPNTSSTCPTTKDFNFHAALNFEAQNPAWTLHHQWSTTIRNQPGPKHQPKAKPNAIPLSPHLPEQPIDNWIPCQT